MEPSKFRSRNVLVVGATGHQGGAVANRLLDENNYNVFALTRSPTSETARYLSKQGAETIQGDLADQASLRRALTDIDCAFLVTDYFSAGNSENERQFGYNFIDTALNQDINHLVFSSAMDADRTKNIPHFNSKYDVEQHLRESESTGTIIRPAPYYQNFEEMMLAVHLGFLPFPFDREAKVPMLDLQDLGTAVATILDDPTAHIDETYDLYGGLYTLDELAKTVTTITGLETMPVSIPTTVVKWTKGTSIATMFEEFNERGRSREESPPSLNIEFTMFEQYLRRENWDADTFATKLGRATAPLRLPLFSRN
jgi:uncharacterized protein YbjT (DUF2867 family)